MADDSANLRFPPGVRWECLSCASCCGSFDLGPVEEHVAAGIAAAADRLGPGAAGWREERVGPGGARAVFLAYRGRACTFLREDRLCAVHAALGADAKPAFCREFPFHMVDDPRGTAVIVRPECEAWHATFRSGPPLEAYREELARLRPHLARRAFRPAAVEVVPGARLGLPDWLALEDELLAGLPPEGATPEGLVAAIRATALARAAVAAPRPDPARYEHAAASVAEGLRLFVGHVASLRDPGAPPHRVAFVRRMAEALAAARAGMAGRAALDPEAAAYVHALLRTHLHGHLWAPSGDLAAGMGQWLLGTLLARAAAGPGPLSPAAFAAVHSPWSKLEVHPAIHDVLLRMREGLRDLFLHCR